MIRGFQNYAGSDDFVREKTIINVGSAFVALLHDSDTVSSNRLKCPNDTTLFLGPKQGCKIIYDTTDDRWFVAQSLNLNAPAYPWLPVDTATYNSWPPSPYSGGWGGSADFVSLAPSVDVLINGIVSSFVFSGISSPVKPIRFLFNTSDTYSVSIAHNSGSATANERVLTDTQETIVLRKDDGVLLIYDSRGTVMKWRAWKLGSRRTNTVRVFIAGTVSSGGEQGGAWEAPFNGRIIRATAYRKGTTGTGGSTIVDVNIEGTTIFTTQSNRPTIPYDDADGKDTAPAIEAGDFSQGEMVTVDVDQVDTGGVVTDLSVILEVEYHK